MSCFVGIYDWMRHVCNPVSVSKRTPNIHDAYYNNSLKGGLGSLASSSGKPVTVTITGVAGQIGYALLPMIAKGDMFGKDTPVIIKGLDLNMPQVLENAKGIHMELEDGSFPLLRGFQFTTEAKEAFTDCDYAVLLGAFPRKQGMERKELMEKNVSIFKTMGEAINNYANSTCKVLVVGNPANTNCLIAQKYAKKLPAENFTAMTRLDHNRAKHQVANKAGAKYSDVARVCIWGNHSSTQYPDVSHATIAGKPVSSVITDKAWIQDEFVKTVQQRGAAIINARKASSALSAARGVCGHINDWHNGTKGDDFVSMAIITPKDNGYGIKEGLCYSFPCKCAGGKWSIVKGLPIDSFSRGKMTATEQELDEERTLAYQIVGA